jgi:glycosyltransferase involved in cell wall biosynthesis
MKICFWGEIDRALKGNTTGGSELQSALLAKALARGGHEVVIIDPETSEDYQTTEGIKILRVKEWNHGIRFMRIFTHRLPKLYLCQKNQKADVYYCRMRDFTHYLAYRASRKVKGKFVLAMASDLDAMNFRMRLKHFYIPNIGYGSSMWWLFSGIFNEIIHPMLLRRSDMVFVQHEGQKQILLKKNIESTIVSNLIDVSQLPVISDPKHNDFIYVGWLDKRKGVTEFFELVQKSPSQTFKIIGPPRDKTGHFYFEKLKSFSNVSLLGELSHSETLKHIANSKALISTSPMEGFPNIFIEAWACGIPVLSLYFDPGGIIKREGLGIVADGNPDIMLKALAEIRYTEDFASRSKAYVENNHILNDNKIKQISTLFNDLVKTGKTDLRS